MNPLGYCLGSTVRSNCTDQPINENEFKLRSSDFFVIQKMVEDDPKRYSDFLRKTFQLRYGRSMQ